MTDMVDGPLCSSDASLGKLFFLPSLFFKVDRQVPDLRTFPFLRIPYGVVHDKVFSLFVSSSHVVRVT
jgi:hypothetical protein